MTISQRLLLLMTLALGALALVVGLGAYKLNQVYDAANYGNINTVPSILVLSRIERSFSTYRLDAYRYTVTTDPAQRDTLSTEIQTLREKLAKGFADYEPLVSDAEDKHLLDAVKSAAAGYFSVVDSAIAQGREGRMPEAQAALLQGRSQGSKVSAALDAHMRYNEELGAKGAKDAESTRSSATTLFFVVAGVVFLVVGILGFTLRASLLSRLGTANDLAARIAAGDLRPDTAGRHQGSNDELGHLMQAMERMRADLADTVGRIIHSGEELGASSDRLSAAAQQVSVSSQNQASSTASSAAAIEQLTVSIDHVGQSADDARQRALKAEELATHSARRMDEATTQVRDVERSVDASAEEIQALSRQVQEIGNITTVIREVADQTNLLALNASIEAARAGEQGRGFAVVADEVRKLAERTSTSVREISAVIATIQQGAETAVRSMEGSRAAVDEVVSAAQGISTAMADIRHATETVQAAVEEISEALREQRGASTELARNVEAIAQMSEENSAAVGSVADTAAGLVTVSSHLHAGIARFKV